MNSKKYEIVLFSGITVLIGIIIAISLIGVAALDKTNLIFKLLWLTLFTIILSGIIFLFIKRKLLSYKKMIYQEKEQTKIIFDSISDNVINLNKVEEKLTNLNVEEALRKSEEMHRLLVSRMTQGIAVHELVFDEAGKVVDHRFIDVNESYERMIGLKREDIIGKTVLEILPGTTSYWIEKFARVAMTGESIKIENYSKEFDKYFEIVAYSPQPNQYAAILSDITKRKQIENQVFNEKERLKVTLLSIGDGVITVDKQGKIEFLNKVAQKLTGFTREEALGKPFEEVFNIINEVTRKKTQNPTQKVYDTGEVVELENGTILISKQGFETPIEDSAAPIRSKYGDINGVVLVFRDVTEKKERLKKIEYLSYNDELTGLYNRRFYEKELKCIDTDSNLPITLVMADVNGLKLTNDAFGHLQGDKLLKKVSEVLIKECRAQDIVARIGGDEFVLLLPKTDSIEGEKIVKRISESIDNEKIDNIMVSVSLGWETKNTAQEEMIEVFKKAEDHMYRNKLNESNSMRSKTIQVITETLYQKNKREEQHSERVSKLCVEIGVSLGLGKEDIRELRTAGLMHDIGKIGIEESILNKQSKLSEAEWLEIRRHPEIGYYILKAVNEFSEIAEIVLSHHERWDGKGYPKGLKAQDILYKARIVNIADAYDAMTSERAYRSALSQEIAISEIKKNAGIQFDPNIARVFVEKVLGKEWSYIPIT